MTTAVGVLCICPGGDTYHPLPLHHAAVLDPLGHVLGDRRFSTDLSGYQQLLDWASNFGIISACGVECTGSYGTGLTRQLLAAEVDVVEGE